MRNVTATGAEMDERIDPELRLLNLRRLIHALLFGRQVSWQERVSPTGTAFNLDWYTPREGVPDLPADKVLALSVLIGDESALPQALADYLIEQGHEYATACYEKGKADQRKQDALASMSRWGEMVRGFTEGHFSVADVMGDMEDARRSPG